MRAQTKIAGCRVCTRPSCGPEVVTCLDKVRGGPAQVPSFTEGGALWFADLSVPDPVYGLPVLTAGMFWAMVELGASDGMEGQDPKMINNMKMFMRFFTPLMVVMGSTLPAVRGDTLTDALGMALGLQGIACGLEKSDEPQLARGFA